MFFSTPLCCCQEALKIECRYVVVHVATTISVLMHLDSFRVAYASYMVAVAPAKNFSRFGTGWLSKWKRVLMRAMLKYCLFCNGSHAFANICSVGATRLDIPNLTPHTITIVICMRPLCCTLYTIAHYKLTKITWYILLLYSNW